MVHISVECSRKLLQIIYFYYKCYESYLMMKITSLYSKIQKVIWSMYGAWNRVRSSGRWGFIINGDTGGHETHSSVWNCICRKSDELRERVEISPITSRFMNFRTKSCLRYRIWHCVSLLLWVL